MAIGTDYPTPVTVNGFQCKNCTDVDYAKKHIDPAHPKSGPYGIDAKDDPTVKKNSDSAAVTFAGNLSPPPAAGNSPDASNGEAIAQPASRPGAQLDISA